MDDNVAVIDVKTMTDGGVHYERLFVRFPGWCRVMDDCMGDLVCVRLKLGGQVCMTKRELVGEDGSVIAAAQLDRLAKSVVALLDKGTVSIERIDMTPLDGDEPGIVAGGSL